MKVAVLGASNKPERYSNKAIKMLLEHEHNAIPVNPAQKTIEGITVIPNLEKLPRDVHTITVYVGPDISSAMKESFLALRPKRVIFNPGAENPDLAKHLEAAGIETVEACTLVMLRTGTFDQSSNRT
jgi:predicted CoA-binding protein